MRLITKFAIYFLLLLLITSCSSQNSVSVRSFTPQDEVNKLTTFTIEFDEPLAPSDTQNVWLNDEFVKFEPKIAGKFKWTDSRTLIFSPDAPLKAIQSYKATVTNKVLFNTTYSPDFETFTFYTPDFDVTKADFFWTQVEGKQNVISIQSNIYFNYSVNPDQLKNYLKVILNDEEVDDWQIVSESSSDVIAVNLGEMAKIEKEQDLEIKVLEGLESIVGKKPLADTRTFTETLEPITKLAIRDVSSGYDGSTGWIVISTTQTVDSKKLSQFISVTPESEIKFFSSGNQIRIEGNFQDHASVRLFVKKGLPGLYGGELEFDYEQEVSLITLEPSISFVDKPGRYLMLDGNENLELDVVNMSEVQVEVEKVFANNITHFLRQNRYSYYDDSYYYEPYYDTYGLGKTIYTEDIKLENKSNWLNKIDINLNKALGGKYNGIYLVTVRSNRDRWRRTSKILAISDLGIIAKRSADNYFVFINSISKAEHVAGVKVEVISDNNQLLFSGVTDHNGTVKFSNIKEKLDEFSPQIITVTSDNDFNFIDLRETQVETSRYDVGGIYNISSYNTFVYSERNLYRPGEKVNLSAIVRTNNYNVVKDLPVLIKIIAPSGKTFGEYKKTLNEQGSFELSFDLPGYTQTGEYYAEIKTGSEELIASYGFSVEDFVPDKLRLTLNCNKEKAMLGESISTDVLAEYLFGGAASNLRYESDVQLRAKNYVSKNFPKFDFNNSSITNTSFPNQLMDGTLDEEGKASLEYIVPNNLVAGGLISANQFVSVFDPTGRTINRRISFDIYSKDYFIGINAPGYYFATNAKLQFKTVAVDVDDNAISNFPITVKLIRYKWKTVLKKDNSDRYSYQSEKQEITEWTKDYEIDGSPTDIDFVLTNSGSYELRVYKTGESQYQKKSFYAYSWGSTTASSFEVDKEGRVDIVLDKETYNPGDKAKILFKAPFAGKMLVTFERDSVYNYQYIDMNERSAELEITVLENYLPNIYVSATLFKPHAGESTSPFLVGHGFTSMKVEKPSNLIPVKIEAPEKIKPNTKQSVTIKTEANENVFVTLAAVDEGILQIKNYQTPDPYAYMFAKRALQVYSNDLYELLLPEIISKKSSTGGDALAAEMQKRTNPIKSDRFKLVSIWSGIRKTNGNGEITVTLDIPQYNGELRLMAVAYKDSRFGKGEERMKVADDLILQPQIPRFLAPKDVLVIPVTVQNTTDNEGEVKLNLNVEGPLQVVETSLQTKTISAKGSALFQFKINVAENVGHAKIVLQTGGIAKVKEEIDIPVRPISPLIAETDAGSIKSNETIELKTNNGFLEGTDNTILTLSSFPALKFANRLSDLVKYPYGCIEQTVSKLFPQLYFEDLVKLVAPGLYKTYNPVYFVKEGIKKIQSMQRYDGSMSYWQGGDYTNWWGSVYAAHFLLEAKQASYNVNDAVLNKLLSYLEKEVTKKETYEYIRSINNKRTHITIAKKEIPYSLYVLAMAGMGDLSTMNYYKARQHLLSKDGLYLLAGSYALMGKWQTANELLPNSFTPENTERTTGGCFDSNIRANAIMLNVLLQVDPTNKQIPYITKYLAENTNVRYHSTQDNAWSFTALGKAAKRNANDNISVDIISDNNVVANYQGKDLSINFNQDKYKSLTLKASGEGELFYYWTTEGIKLKGDIIEEDAQMKVRRTYFDYKTKNQIPDNIFYQGQLVVCKLTLTGFSRSAENVVIADLLPSGFEIDNPRLAASTDLDWKLNKPMQIDYVDIRDDRLLLFTNLNSNKTNEYLYLLRVVNQGEFALPAIGAEAMYDKELHSYNGKGKVIVTPNQ